MRRGGKYFDWGVGLDLGIDSGYLLEGEEEDESNEDLFGPDADEEPTMAGLSASQSQEALRLKREKLRIERERRRRDDQRKICIQLSVMISWRHMMAFGRK